MIEYRKIQKRDIPLITELYAQYLNSGESISQSIRDAWEKGDYSGYIAVCGDKPAGFFAIREGIAFTYPHPELEAELSEFTKDKKTGYCDAILVTPEYRLEGVADRLREKSTRLLLKEGYEYFLAEIWIYPDGNAPARTTFESMGKPVWQKRIDGFYSELEKYGMGCPICGSRCVCGAWIEIIDLKRGKDDATEE
jgi:GNAT superfamily N-acetyltransferase